MDESRKFVKISIEDKVFISQTQIIEKNFGLVESPQSGDCNFVKKRVRTIILSEIIVK